MNPNPAVGVPPDASDTFAHTPNFPSVGTWHCSVDVVDAVQPAERGGGLPVQAYEKGGVPPTGIAEKVTVWSRSTPSRFGSTKTVTIDSLPKIQVSFDKLPFVGDPPNKRRYDVPGVGPVYATRATPVRGSGAAPEVGSGPVQVPFA
jgi:hypothetical protein